MHDVDAVQVLYRERHLRQEGAPARGCAGRRGAVQCVHARAMRCARLRPRPRERPRGVRGVRCAGGQARLCEDGESIVLLERAFGQQVLEELPAGQALLRSASRGRVGVCGCVGMSRCRAATPAEIRVRRLLTWMM